MGKIDTLLGPALLFCPGDRPDRFEKALAAADVAVLDLEDGVGALRKDAALAAVTAFLAQGQERVIVRVNPPLTERGRAEIAAVVEAGAGTLLLPKTQSNEEIDAVLAAVPAGKTVSLIPSVENVKGALAVESFLGRPEIAGLGWGPYDIAADLGLLAVRDETGAFLSPILQLRDRMLCMAALAGVAVYDSVTTEYSNTALLERDLHEAVELGMVGKFSIHPSQTAPIRAAFVPDRAEVERYRRMLDADVDGGAFAFEGEMVDGPILRRARRVVAVAERAATMKKP